MQAVQEGMGTLFLQWTVGSEHVRYSGGSEIIGIDFEYECPYQWVGQNQSETFFSFFFTSKLICFGIQLLFLKKTEIFT